MSFIDLLIVIVYLTVIVWVGIKYRGRQDNTTDYFTTQGGFAGVFGSIIVGLSVGATLFSGLSFVAIPSNAFTFGVTAMSGLFMWPLFYFLMRYWFLPRYLAKPQNSPYDIVERRFGLPVRRTISGMFIACRVVWMSAVIYVPALLLTTGGTLGPEWFWPVVILIGVSSTLYTVIGGIRGVIITDALQFVLIAGVLIATILYIVFRIPLTFAEVTTYVEGNTRLLAFNWSLSLTETMTVMAMLFGGGAQMMVYYTSDPMLLQRYLAAGNQKEASSAVGTSIVTQVGVLLMLAVVGLALGAWYSLHPDPALPKNSDRVFPYFVATNMPVGFVGLIAASILAATMSSVTSGISALSGALLNDFRSHIASDEKARLKHARVTSAVIGLVSTMGAGLVEHLGTLFNIMNLYYGIFLGPMMGCMICTVGRRAVNGRVLIVAMFVGCFSGMAVGYSVIANLWVSLITCGVTLLVAHLGSLIVKPDAAQIARTKA
jgi:SSS family solute:Na+ symporter